MAACSKYKNRLSQALEFRQIPFPLELYNVLAKRATTDRSLDDIITGVCNILEPPRCQKSHCPSHTAYAFCGCSKQLVPGKCSLNLDYLKGVKEREEKLKEEIAAWYGATIAEINFDRLLSHFGGITRLKERWKRHIELNPTYNGVNGLKMLTWQEEADELFTPAETPKP